MDRLQGCECNHVSTLRFHEVFDCCNARRDSQILIFYSKFYATCRSDVAFHLSFL